MKRRTYLLPLFALCAAQSAAAATFCVSTGTQLFNALNTADSNGQDDIIRIVQGNLTGGTSAAGDPLWPYRPTVNDITTGLNISGGWNSACTSQVQNPQLTVLDPNYTGPGLDFFNLSGEPLTGTFVVRNLTITRARGEFQSRGAAFNWLISGSVSNSLLLENMLVVASQSIAVGGVPVGVSQTGSGRVVIRNMVINNNFMTASNNTGGMTVETGGSATAFVSNNSIFENSATSFAAGLLVSGVITLSNNVVADNTSSFANFAQVGSPAAAGLSLNRNHFGSTRFVGTVASDVGTTTGDPQWTYTGSIATPNLNSVLRNTGTNSPLGGLASTDFAGNARIVDVTVDRGAIEAATGLIGPTIQMVSPLSGGGTNLPRGLPGTTSATTLLFSASGGVAPSVTNLNCVDDDSNVTLSASAIQNIGVGQSVQPVIATYANTTDNYIWKITCTTSTNGFPPTTLDHTYQTPQSALLGPAVEAVSPSPGSTTALPGVQLNQVVTADILFSAQGGVTGGDTSLSCAPLASPISISSGASQTVFTGATVDPVKVAMTIGNAPKFATVRCVIGRAGEPFRNVDFSFSTGAAVLFAHGFEN